MDGRPSFAVAVCGVALAAVGAAPSPARADDAPGVRAHADADDPTTLTLDPALRFDPAEGILTETTERHLGSFALGPRARLATETRLIANGLPIAPDQQQYGWQAAGRFDVELKWGIHLEVDASLMQLAPELNGMFGRGLIAGYGLALTRYFHWSLGRVAWISLGVEHTSILGDRAIGIPAGTTAGIRIGTTF